MRDEEQRGLRREPTTFDEEFRGHRAPEAKAHMQAHPIIEGHAEASPAGPPPPPPAPIPGVENIARPTPPPPQASRD
jgi:hypothetical protein